jgi:hypothetical protein
MGPSPEHDSEDRRVAACGEPGLPVGIVFADRFAEGTETALRVANAFGVLGYGRNGHADELSGKDMKNIIMESDCGIVVLLVFPCFASCGCAVVAGRSSARSGEGASFRLRAEEKTALRLARLVGIDYFCSMSK